MKKNTNLRMWLSGALIVQLILIAVVFNTSKNTEQPENRNLIPAQSNIDRVVIADNKVQSELLRDGDHWILPNLQNLPVDAKKWQAQLDKLNTQQLRWPVASSSTSHERFDVSNEKFNKRIDLYSEQSLVSSFYIGSSLGLKESYVRELENDKTFTVDLNAADLPSDDNTWLDKKLLQLDQITTLKTQTFELEKRDNTWVLVQGASDIGEDQSSQSEERLSISDGELSTDQPISIDLIQDKVIEIENTLSSLIILNTASGVNIDSSDSLTAVNKMGATTYSFSTEGGKYYVDSNNSSGTFEISKSTYEKLANLSIDLILEKREQKNDVEENQ